MLVLVNLDIFAQFLAAWHTNIEPHKLPESGSSKSSMLAMAADTGNSGTIMLFVVVDGCKMLHNGFLDSMSHFVQDKFHSTNSEDKIKHIQYMSKKHTREKKKNISSTHLTKHIENIFKTYRVNKNTYPNDIFIFNF